LSNAIFPKIRGLSWDISKTPEWSTKSKRSASGKTVRASFWSFPIWHFKLKYAYIRDSDAADSDLKTIIGFFNQRMGAFDSFLYECPDDNTATNQVIALGDGVTTTFQLCRDYGGFIEPIHNPKEETLVVFLNGVKTTAFSVDGKGRIVFTTPPAQGVAISASFKFYFRVTFAEDEEEFEQFAYRLYQLQTLELISVKE